MSDDAGDIYVYDFTCPDVVTAPASPTCAGTPFPRGVAAELVAYLANSTPVHVVGPDGNIPGNTPNQGHGAIVTFGPSRSSGGRRYVQISYVCGGLCGAGATLTLEARNGGWTVTGQTGPSWIS